MMSAKSLATTASAKTKKKVSKKASEKVSKKVSKKAAAKAGKKTAAKTGEKVSKKTAAKTGKKVSKKTASKAVRNSPKKAPGQSRKTRQPATATSGESRHQMIEKAAYYLAESRNFQDGDPVADWLLGEKQIDELLSLAADRH